MIVNTWLHRQSNLQYMWTTILPNNKWCSSQCNVEGNSCLCFQHLMCVCHHIQYLNSVFSLQYKVCVDGFIHYECLRETLSPGLSYSNPGAHEQKVWSVWVCGSMWACVCEMTVSLPSGETSYFTFTRSWFCLVNKRFLWHAYYTISQELTSTFVCVCVCVILTQ